MAILSYGLWLHRAGRNLCQRLISHLPELGSVAALQDCSEMRLKSMGFTVAQIKHLLSPDWARIQPTLDWLEESPQHQAILYTDSRYPALLKQIPDPPLVLYLKGRAEILNKPQLAIVGSRKSTPSAGSIAFDWAKALTLQGVTITSGLALGIDAQAHQGALAGGGPTIAVMGTSPDLVYPSQHGRLACDILARGGALVSELWPSTAPLAENFPRRNRIISGLSQGVLVVEAALRSGSLITARMALEQNREVFAIPGSIHNLMARGTNHLIKQGAKLVDCLEDIAEEFNLQQSPEKNFQEAGQDAVLCTQLEEDERAILRTIEDQVTSVEAIVTHTGYSVQRVSSRLVELQFQGLIKAMPGGYVRVRRAQHERECA